MGVNSSMGVSAVGREEGNKDGVLPAGSRWRWLPHSNLPRTTWAGGRQAGAAQREKSQPGNPGHTPLRDPPAPATHPTRKAPAPLDTHSRDPGNQ